MYTDNHLWCLYYDMKRAHKLLLGSVLLLGALIFFWCLLCPVLFPQQMKAANDKYQAWIGGHPAGKN